MQQRQLRLGDILDDYCPRERRLTNHAVVAMVEADVKRTRCTTCDAEHEYRHAKIPHQRRKPETPAALYSQVLANGPKKIVHDVAEPSPEAEHASEPVEFPAPGVQASEEGEPLENVALRRGVDASLGASGQESRDENSENDRADQDVEGPVHRRLIRATLPRTEGQPPQRPIPEFTIRQPGGRQNRFRGRPGRGNFQGGRVSGAGGGPPRSGRPQGGPGRPRQGHGRKRSK